MLDVVQQECFFIKMEMRIIAGDFFDGNRSILSRFSHVIRDCISQHISVVILLLMGSSIVLGYSLTLLCFLTNCTTITYFSLKCNKEEVKCIKLPSVFFISNLLYAVIIVPPSFHFPYINNLPGMICIMRTDVRNNRIPLL